MMPQTWKTWLALALIFAVGAVSGSALTFWLAPPTPPRPPGTLQMKSRMLNGLTARLKLTPDQQAKVDPIVTDIQTQVQAVRHEEGGRIAHIMEGLKERIFPILTTEQQGEFQKMEKEMEAQRERMFPGHKSHAASGPGQPGDASPPSAGGSLPPEGPPPR